LDLLRANNNINIKIWKHKIYKKTKSKRKVPNI
jgi:hypothetical protein